MPVNVAVGVEDRAVFEKSEEKRESRIPPSAAKGGLVWSYPGSLEVAGVRLPSSSKGRRHSGGAMKPSGITLEHYRPNEKDVSKEKAACV
jgi:hypothetical protein